MQIPFYYDYACPWAYLGSCRVESYFRDLGATKMMARNPVWPVLGPPQGIWEDIYPLGEARVHEPVYKHSPVTSGP